MLFSPGIYEHAAALIYRTPWEVSRSGVLLAQAHETAWQKYHHPLVVVGIDVYNLEPEAYGATIAEPARNNIPAISSHPCQEVCDLFELPVLEPMKHSRIREVLKAGQIIKKNCPDSHVHIPICGPFALAIGLLGMDGLLMGVIEDPEELMSAMRHLLKGQKAYLEAIKEAGLKPIVFESGTTPPLLPPKAFREIEAPLLNELFTFAKNVFGESLPCIIGGDAAPIAEAFLESGPSWVIAPSETDQSAFLKTAMPYPEIHVRINMSAQVLLSQSSDDLRTEVERVKKLAQTRANTSVGCGVVPFETDPKTILLIKSLISQDNNIQA